MAEFVSIVDIDALIQKTRLDARPSFQRMPRIELSLIWIALTYKTMPWSPVLVPHSTFLQLCHVLHLGGAASVLMFALLPEAQIRLSNPVKADLVRALFDGRSRSLRPMGILPFGRGDTRRPRGKGDCAPV